jgi:hypothetical protein
MVIETSSVRAIELNDYSKIFSSLLTKSKGVCDNRDFSDPNFGDEVMESENLHFQKMSTRFQLFAKCPR